MPEVISTDTNAKDMREAAEKELKSRRETIGKAQSYYDGDQKKHIKIKNNIDPNVIDNLCAEVIDSTASFLVPDMPELAIDGDQDATNWLNEAWEENDGASLLLDIATNGGIAGHIFTRLMMGDDYPMVRGVDARNWLVWWKADDYKSVDHYESQWGKQQDGTNKYRQDIIPIRNSLDEIVRWEIVEYQRNGDRWQQSDVFAWNYPLSPVVDWCHLPQAGYKYYGANETPKHLITVQDMINKVSTDIGQIIRYHAYPKTVVIGADDEVDEEEHGAINDEIWLTNTNAKVFNLEMASDLSASRAERDHHRMAFLRKARVVTLPADLNAFRGVTNLGIRTLYLPQSTKAKTLRRKYGQGIIGLSKRMLMLAGIDYDVNITIEWGSALPTDERETLQLLQMELMMGILSRRMAAQQRGRDYDQVRQELQDEAQVDRELIDGVPMTGVA